MNNQPTNKQPDRPTDRQTHKQATTHTSKRTQKNKQQIGKQTSQLAQTQSKEHVSSEQKHTGRLIKANTHETLIRKSSSSASATANIAQAQVSTGSTASDISSEHFQDWLWHSGDGIFPFGAACWKNFRDLAALFYTSRRRFLQVSICSPARPSCCKSS